MSKAQLERSYLLWDACITRQFASDFSAGVSPPPAAAAAGGSSYTARCPVTVYVVVGKCSICAQPCVFLSHAPEIQSAVRLHKSSALPQEVRGAPADPVPHPMSRALPPGASTGARKLSACACRRGALMLVLKPIASARSA